MFMYFVFGYLSEKVACAAQCTVNSRAKTLRKSVRKFRIFQMVISFSHFLVCKF